MTEKKEENFFCENLRELISENNISQRKLAEETGVSVASINNYINGISEPSIFFILALKECYHINIDDFLTKRISKQVSTNQTLLSFAKENINRFIGHYICYYYDSSSYKGKVKSSSGILKYGVISVYGDGNALNKNLIVEASFIKDKLEAEALKTKLDSVTDSKDILALHGENNQNYSGLLDMSFSQFFISLKSGSYDDRTLMIFNNPPSAKRYIGGMGTVNSISRGREHMPCIQYVLLSRNVLNLPEGEIYNMLSLGISEVNVRNETEHLINLFKNLYLNHTDQSMTLEEYQKVKIIENSLQSIVEDSIDANVFRYAKVNSSEDDDFYRILKENQ